MSTPKLLAMLSIQPPIQGDETLLHLAQTRLAEAGLGGELYPGTPEHLSELISFRPAGRASTAHLPRGIDVLEIGGRASLMEYAQRAAGILLGILIHDQKAFADDLPRAIQAFRQIDQALASMPSKLLLFVEYAAGLDPEIFARLFEETAELEFVCAAVDVSHVGIHLCRAAYAERYPGEDVCALRPDSPELPQKIDDVQAVVKGAQTTSVELVARLARLGKPLHFHLHDGHPLSTLSEFGVSDHLSFLQQIRLPFLYHGKQTIEGIFGLSGLRALVQSAMIAMPPGQLSFMLEVHPQEGRAPLREHSHLFGHWQDKYFAERMNYWLDTLLENAALVRDACDMHL
jgi:hypothetical protein